MSRQPQFRFAFNQLPSSWELKCPDLAAYDAQKSILLDFTQEETVHPLYETEEDGVESVWKNVYERRIELLRGNLFGVPSVFPGRSPATSHTHSAENLAIERFQAFEKNRFFVCSEIDTAANDDSFDVGHWMWRSLSKPAFKKVTCLQATPRKDISGFEQDVRTVAGGVDNISELTSAFQVIHAYWANVPSVQYDEDALAIALSSLRQAANEELVAVALELEEFVSYCSLRKKLNVVASGFYLNKWVDVAAAKVNSLQATEKCWPVRLLQEIQNLAMGRTAPLVINELGCVADGNHRLAAAWIWNMLHFCKNVAWQTGYGPLESRLSAFIEENGNDTCALAIANALEGLSFILNNEHSKRALLTLSPEIMSHQIDTLPVVPVLVYNSLAIDRHAFESEGNLVRFDPLHYAVLQRNSHSFLPARACYHFADRVPLPWFAVLRTVSREQIRSPHIFPFSHVQ